MRTYVLVTGLLFTLLSVVHVWRLAVEGVHAGSHGWHLLLILLPAALAVWAWRLLRKQAR